MFIVLLESILIISFGVGPCGLVLALVTCKILRSWLVNSMSLQHGRLSKQHIIYIQCGPITRHFVLKWMNVVLEPRRLRDAQFLTHIQTNNSVWLCMWHGRQVESLLRVHYNDTLLTPIVNDEVQRLCVHQHLQFGTIVICAQYQQWKRLIDSKRMEETHWFKED